MRDTASGTKDDKKSTRGSKARDAIKILSDIRDGIIGRMANHILEQQTQLRSEINSPDSYSFTMQKIEENYMNRINLIERALHELSRLDVREVSTTFEAIKVTGSHDELRQKLCDLLADRANAVLMDIVAMKIDDANSELMVVLSTEERH